MMTSFVERLRAACDANRSLVCVGLDVDADKIPESVFRGDRDNPRHRAQACARFNQEIVDATRDMVCAYKPNPAFYVAEGLWGLWALKKTIRYIKEVAPNVVVIGDSKMGDIENTAEKYAKAMFGVMGFDAVTINAWGGRDTAEPWLSDPTHGAFIWCRGSNPGSEHFQDLWATNKEEVKAPMYLHMAIQSKTWAVRDNLGLVMGATAPEELKEVRKVCRMMPFLIPGVGAQGGDLADAVRYGVDEHGRMAIINSSRGVIYASSGKGYAESARKATKNLRTKINLILEEMGVGWDAPAI